VGTYLDMKIAIWNINLVRLRIQLVTDWLKEHQPDVLCLQETKTQDEFFPHEALESMS
jgi:exodeoxyribonuclease III